MWDKIEETIEKVRYHLEDKAVRFGVIAVIVLILVLVLVGKSYGQFSGVMVFQGDGDRIVLEMTECKNKTVLGMIKPEAHPMFHGGTYVVTGPRVEQRRRARRPVVIDGCWTASNDGQAVITVWEDGDVFPVPLHLFKPGDPAAKKSGYII